MSNPEYAGIPVEIDSALPEPDWTAVQFSAAGRYETPMGGAIDAALQGIYPEPSVRNTVPVPEILYRAASRAVNVFRRRFL